MDRPGTRHPSRTAWDGFTLQNCVISLDGSIRTLGYWCELGFDGPDSLGLPPHGAEDRAGWVELVLDVDEVRASAGQNLILYLNGLRLAAAFVEDCQALVCRFAGQVLRRAGNVLTIDTPDAVSTARFAVTMARPPGLRLHSVRLRPAA